MNLSDAQKRTLRESRLRLIAASEAARARREELWHRLSCRMVGDDRRSMERISLVRGVGLVALMKNYGRQQMATCVPCC